MILVHQKLIMLTALIAVFLAFNKLKSGFFLHRSRALNIMAGGCALLIFGNLIGLIGSMGVFGPGYSKSLIYFGLESVVGYIFGWVLIVWGMAKWLPYLFSVSNRLQKKNKSVKLYESISKVSTYGSASPSTFTKIAESVLENYGFQAASFHIMNRANQLSLFASTGLSPKSRDYLEIVKDSLYDKVYKTGEVFQADDSIRLHKDIIIETGNGPVVDALAMPVDFGAKRIGVMTIYTDHARVFAQEELGVLDAVCNNLGLTFYKDGLQRSISAQKAFKDFIAVILKTSRSEGDLNTRVIRLAKLLEQYIKYESLNLHIWSNGSPQILDFNLPTGRKVVIEKGYLKGARYEPIRWVMENHRGLTLPEDASFIKSDFKPATDKRILFTPVIVDGRVMAVLNISVDGSYHFNQNDMIAADAIASAISGTILEELNKAAGDDAFDRIGAIKYAIETTLTGESASNIYRELARMLVEKTPATFCRVMMLNDRRDRFQTAAIYQRRELLWDERTITGLPLADLYSHRKAIVTGKPIVIGDMDSNLKISELEARLLMPEGISQCMIAPIIIDGNSVGVVTIGESRRSDRDQFGVQQMVFALLLTNLVSVVVGRQHLSAQSKKLAESNRLAIRKINGYENRADTFRMVDGFNSQINGPLAGILASCEYVLSRPDISREEMERYINVINRNAGKIHKLTNRLAEAKKAIENISESLVEA